MKKIFLLLVITCVGITISGSLYAMRTGQTRREANQAHCLALKDVSRLSRLGAKLFFEQKQQKAVGAKSTNPYINGLQEWLAPESHTGAYYRCLPLAGGNRIIVFAMIAGLLMQAVQADMPHVKTDDNSGLMKFANGATQTVTIPSAGVLELRLQDEGLAHFAEKTHIADQLGGQQLTPQGVVIAVETALYDYHEEIKKGMPESMASDIQIQMQERKSDVLEILLRKSPQALREVPEALQHANTEQHVDTANGGPGVVTGMTKLIQSAQSFTLRGSLDGKLGGAADTIGRWIEDYHEHHAIDPIKARAALAAFMALDRAVALSILTLIPCAPLGVEPALLAVSSSTGAALFTSGVAETLSLTMGRPLDPAEARELMQRSIEIAAPAVLYFDRTLSPEQLKYLSLFVDLHGTGLMLSSAEVSAGINEVAHAGIDTFELPENLLKVVKENLGSPQKGMGAFAPTVYTPYMQDAPRYFKADMPKSEFAGTWKEPLAKQIQFQLRGKAPMNEFAGTWKEPLVQQLRQQFQFNVPQYTGTPGNVFSQYTGSNDKKRF